MFGHSPENVAMIEPEPEVIALLVALVQALGPRYVIETGCYHGTTSAALGRALDVGRLDTMDIDEYSVGLARTATKGLPVTVHHCSSLDFVPTQPVDFVFLDSGIGELRMKEAEHFAPFMAPGGVFAMHDSRDLPWPDHGFHWINLPTPRGLLVMQR